MPTDSRIARENATTVAEKAHVKHQSKRDLRTTLLNARVALAATERRAHDAAIGLTVAAWLAAHPAQVLGVYWPIRGEPDLHGLYARLEASGVRLALPVMVGADAPLTFAAWSPGDAIQIDRWGIATPINTLVVQPQALLIPCVGYDTRRFRLGYGAGYYDRTLTSVPRPQAIGIAYSGSRADFEVESHDRAMDVVITEEGPV